MLTRVRTSPGAARCVSSVCRVCASLHSFARNGELGSVAPSVRSCVQSQCDAAAKMMFNSGCFNSSADNPSRHLHFTHLRQVMESYVMEALHEPIFRWLAAWHTEQTARLGRQLSSMMAVTQAGMRIKTHFQTDFSAARDKLGELGRCVVAAVLVQAARSPPPVMTSRRGALCHRLAGTARRWRSCSACETSQNSCKSRSRNTWLRLASTSVSGTSRPRAVGRCIGCLTERLRAPTLSVHPPGVPTRSRRGPVHRRPVGHPRVRHRSGTPHVRHALGPPQVHPALPLRQQQHQHPRVRWRTTPEHAPRACLSHAPVPSCACAATRWLTSKSPSTGS